MEEVEEEPDRGPPKSLFLCQVSTSDPGFREMLLGHKAKRIIVNTSSTPDVNSVLARALILPVLQEMRKEKAFLTHWKEIGCFKAPHCQLYCRVAY